jgi:hypothetical protein
MAALNIPTSFSNNSTADANQVNGNFQAIVAWTNTDVVRTDGSVKAQTNAIADDAVTAAKIATGAVGTTEIADASVTAAKLAAGVTTLKFQDHTITGLSDIGFGFGWTTAETKLALTGGKQYGDVVSIQCLGGLNAYGMSARIAGLGLQSGVLLGGEIIVQAAVSNNAAGGNYAIVRIWTV